MEFNELNLAEMDKDLTAEERAEWQAIFVISDKSYYTEVVA